MWAQLMAVPGQTLCRFGFFVALGGNEQFGALGCRLPAKAGLHVIE
jgi:hypothetical protein